MPAGARPRMNELRATREAFAPLAHALYQTEVPKSMSVGEGTKQVSRPVSLKYLSKSESRNTEILQEIRKCEYTNPYKPMKL